MYLLDIIPLTRIPHAQPQILSYFHGAKLPAGALVQIPLGRRQEEGVVIASRDLADYKMEIKNANFELRNISKIISSEAILTNRQIESALFLGQYYFCSPGTFLKMALPPYYSSSQAAGRVEKSNNTVLDSAPTAFRSNNKKITQTLILVPTISQVHSLYKSYSSNSVIWHSELTQKQKIAAWLTVKTSQVQIIIGTRSAVFLPFANLKEIIIEDKTNPNHKSWDMFPHYDSRLAAQKLTEIFKAKLILKNNAPDPTSSLSPSRREGETKRGWAPRANDRALLAPPAQIIDMRQELKDGNFSIFSVTLHAAIKKALAENRQVILFINRRGAANFILCRDCGYIAKCSNCDAPLTYHLINSKPSLLCHHCGAKDAVPVTCPKCHSWRIKTVGSGSQKVESETKKFFPNAKILRLDSDSAAKPKDQQKIITDFTKRQADILIATPMIFSWLDELAAARPALVGILSADTLLHIPDFRSGERTWQTITSLQNLLFTPHFVKGGLGGILNQPQFFIQTYNPDNSVLKYLKNNDYEGFVKEDLATREALNYPPFAQIVKLTFRLRDAKRAGQEAKILAAKLIRIMSHLERSEGSKKSRNEFGMTKNEHADSIELSPALPAFVPRERGKYIWNIIIKFLPFTTPHFVKGGLGGIFFSPDFLQHRNSLLQYVPQNWEIDVDPENLL